MDTFIEDSDGKRFANGQNNRDLRVGLPMGTLHGGVLCDVADAAMGAAYRSILTDGESFTTLELKINSLRPVWKAKLRAEASMVRAGKIVGLVERKHFRRAATAGGARVEHLYDAARRTRGGRQPSPKANSTT